MKRYTVTLEILASHLDDARDNMRYPLESLAGELLHRYQLRPGTPVVRLTGIVEAGDVAEDDGGL